jgi:outer membrane protein OmpA-like peptidoglycan-associated protein
LDLASQHDVLGSLKLSAGFPAAHGGMFGLEVEGRASLTRVDLRGGATFVTGGLHLRGEFTARGEAWLNGGPRGFVELLAGVRYLLRPLELSLLTGPGYGLASQGFDYRLVLGVAFVSPSAEESDAARVASTDCTEGTDYKLDDCPDLDFDNDGVRNRVDRCPREFGERRNQGCPWPDTDGDTLVDHQDNCPKVPGPVENFGCPREQKQLVQIGRDKLEISERVFFEFNKAIIKPESFELLDQVAAVIENHPELRVRVEGHTDKVGSADYNHTLSLARAQAVKAYLTERGGISAGRLSVAGFGFDVPIATNDTDEGRARNRRVEFMFEDAEP